MLNLFNLHLIMSFIKSHGPSSVDMNFIRPNACPEGMHPDIEKLMAKCNHYLNPSSGYKHKSWTKMGLFNLY